jgi:hypothetical protein
MGIKNSLKASSHLKKKKMEKKKKKKQRTRQQLAKRKYRGKKAQD